MSFLDFIRPAAAVAVSRVRITEPTRARAIGENMSSDAAPGDVIDVTREDAATLIGAGRAELLAQLDDKGDPIPSKARKIPPAPAKPAAAPADWKDMPPEFLRAHDFLARRAALVADINAAIESTLPPGFKNASLKRDGLAFYAYGQAGNNAVENRLKKSEIVEAAGTKLREFDKSTGDALGRSMLAVGNVTHAKVQAANAATEELTRIAFDTFSARLAPLELDPAHRHKLFAGSGLAQRYAKFAPINPGCAVFTGGPSPKVTLDAPLATLAAYYRIATDRLAEVENLLAQARAELDAAQGATFTPTRRKPA
jgi:hypothetical protein